MSDEELRINALETAIRNEGAKAVSVEVLEDAAELKTQRPATAAEDATAYRERNLRRTPGYKRPQP